MKELTLQHGLRFKDKSFFFDNIIDHRSLHFSHPKQRLVSEPDTNQHSGKQFG